MAILNNQMVNRICWDVWTRDFGWCWPHHDDHDAMAAGRVGSHATAGVGVANTFGKAYTDCACSNVIEIIDNNYY